MPVAPEILATTLEHYGHGRALWCPEPPIDDGVPHEIQIGDVGFFDEDGGFKRLFNVRYDENHELNKGGVPDGFVPLQFSHRLVSERRDHFPPTPFYSRTVKSQEAEGHVQAQAGNYAGVNLSYNFQCTSSVGGLLILRDGGDKTTVPSAQTITQYIRQHHASWHAFATDEVKYGITCNPEDIVLVRGFVKTSAWAVAAFPDGGASQSEISFSGTAGPFADAGFHFAKHHQRQVAFEHRIGPKRPQSRPPSIASGKARATEFPVPDVEGAAEGEGAARDQTVFLGYFKMLRRRFWRKKIKAAGGYDTLQSPDDDDSEPDTTIEAHPRHEPLRTALDDVLEYILARSDAELAIVSDAEISDLFGGEVWPENMADWLEAHLPTVDVDDDKTGTLSILDSIRRAHAVAAQEQETAAALAWEARQAELMAQHEREEEERAIREVEEREAREREALEKAEKAAQEEAASREKGKQPAQGPEQASSSQPVPAGEGEADTTMEDAGEKPTGNDAPGEPGDGRSGDAPSGSSGGAGQPSSSEPGPSAAAAPTYVPEFLEERVSGTCVTTEGEVVVGGGPGGARSSVFPHTVLSDKSAEGGGVSSVSISKSGMLVATGCEDCFVRVWDLEIGSLTSRFDKHTDTVWTVAFAPDGVRLLSGSADKTAILWNLQTRELVQIMEGHDADVWLSDFSPDGRFVATGSVDCTVRLWDGRNGRHLYTFDGHNAVIMGVKFSPDSRRLATYADNMGYLWDVASGAPLAKLQGHTSVIWSLAFSADSQRIVTAAEDQSSRVWDVESGVELVTLNEHTGPVWSAVFSSDGTQVASGSYDTLVIVCDSFTGERYHTLERDSSSIVNIVAYSAKGDLLAAGHADGIVRVYDPRSGEFVAEFRGHDDKVKTVEFMPDDNLLVSSSDDGTVRIWNMLEALRL